MPSSERVGILGGGQLAKMLVEAAGPLGISPVVFADNPAECAVKVAPRHVFGKLGVAADVEKFLAEVSLVIFENEFIDTKVLSQVKGGVKFVPSLDTISRLRDKRIQKECFEKHGLPTATFVPYVFPQKIADWAPSAVRELGGEAVLKWGGMGYDGKGILLVNEGSASDPKTLAFCQTALDRGVSLYAETLVKFKRELAILGCRSTKGEWLTYPLVLSEQWEGICDTVLAPATAFGVPAALEAEAARIAKSFAEKEGIYGVFALELFETADGKILINEMAPRVHNSGHYSQDAGGASQFRNHLLACLGEPLQNPVGEGCFVMLNLLGPAGVSKAVSGEFAKMPPGVVLHWYGKAEIRPKRKVGHLNARVAEANAAQQQLKAMRAWRDEWARELEKK